MRVFKIARYFVLMHNQNLTRLLHLGGVSDERQLDFLAGGGTHGADDTANICEQEDAVKEDDLRLQTGSARGARAIDPLERARE